MSELAPNPKQELGAAATGSVIEQVPAELQAQTQPTVEAPVAPVIEQVPTELQVPAQPAETTVSQPLIDHAPGMTDPMQQEATVVTPESVAAAQAQPAAAPEQAPPFSA